MRIKNALTGEVTTDIVGSKAELKYYRVIDASNREENPQKLFYVVKTDYFLDVLLKRFKNSILENYTSSIRMNINSIENNWDEIKRLSDKRALAFVINIISTEPIVSFSTISDNQIYSDIKPAEKGFVTVGKRKRKRL
jgi:hypothetical protein|tara:strand:+ start:583 stop:996 length:414 start_codon:yes stop_codon:yes gene_type:complete